MSRPARIHHANIIIKSDKAKELIRNLHEHGVCQLKESKIDLDSEFDFEDVKKIDDLQSRFNAVVDALDEYQEIIAPGSRFKALFRPDPPDLLKSGKHTSESLIEEVEYHLDLIEPKVTSRVDELSENREIRAKNEFLIENLGCVPDVKTTTFQSTENIKVFLGLINNSSIDDLKMSLPESSVYGIEERDEAQSLLTLFVSPDETQHAERALHKVGFAAVEVPYENKKPKDIITELKKENEKLVGKAEKIKAFLSRLHRVYKKKFIVMKEELGIARSKIEARKNFKSTKALTLVDAWVPFSDAEQFKKIVSETSKEHMIEFTETKDAPTKYNNKPWVQPFEMITNLYSPPKYGEFDPTIIMTFWFTLFFGFMLTDAAYGLLLLFSGIAIHRGLGKYNPVAKTFSGLMIYFGISTTLLGALFGSYFGNFFQEAGIMLPVPIDPMTEVMTVLMIALTLGFIHLGVGLVTGFIEGLRKKAYKDAISNQGIWLIFMVGVILLLITKNTTIGLTPIFLAVVMHMIFKTIEGGPVTGVLAIFDFTGFIGDLFSYARLMALALGTSGIALAVNFMIFLVAGSNPYIGWIFGIVIFLFGHALNIFMNGLGAFVHTTRLHFLELFTKFYDGGGRLYEPFKAKRETTYV